MRGEVGDQLFPGFGWLWGHVMSVLVVRVMRHLASFHLSLACHVHRERTSLPRIKGTLPFRRLYLQATGIDTAVIAYKNKILRMYGYVSQRPCTFPRVSVSGLFCKAGWLLMEQLSFLPSPLFWSLIVGCGWKKQNLTFSAFCSS